MYYKKFKYIIITIGVLIIAATIFSFIFSQSSSKAKSGENNYVLKIGQQKYSEKQFNSILTNQYRDRLTESLIESYVLKEEASKNKIKILDTEVNERIKYLIEYGYSDLKESNESSFKSEVKNNLILEKLMAKETPVPETGYYRFYLSYTAHYNNIVYELTKFESHDENIIHKITEEIVNGNKDINKISKNIGVNVNEFKNFIIKEADLPEVEKINLEHINEGDALAYGEDIIFLDKKNVNRLPYEKVKQRVKTDYAIVTTSMNKELYFKKIIERYPIISNTRYFNKNNTEK